MLESSTTAVKDECLPHHRVRVLAVDIMAWTHEEVEHLIKCGKCRHRIKVSRDTPASKVTPEMSEA